MRALFSNGWGSSLRPAGKWFILAACSGGVVGCGDLGPAGTIGNEVASSSTASLGSSALNPPGGSGSALQPSMSGANGSTAAAPNASLPSGTDSSSTGNGNPGASVSDDTGASSSSGPDPLPMSSSADTAAPSDSVPSDVFDASIPDPADPDGGSPAPSTSLGGPDPSDTPPDDSSAPMASSAAPSMSASAAASMSASAAPSMSASAAPSMSASAPPPPPPTGPELFATYCAACHGADGEGTTLGPELQHPDPEHMTWVVRNGGSWDMNGTPSPVLSKYKNIGSSMPAYSSGVVSDTQLDEMITWLQSFPQPTTGQELFADYCSHCHGDDGKGGGSAVNGAVTAYATVFHSAPFCRVTAGTAASEFMAEVKAGFTSEGPEERRKHMPAFQGVLTDNEITLIWNWTPLGTNLGNPNCTLNAH